MSTVFAEEAVYVHEVAHLNGADIARATGVASSTARAWLARTRSPGRTNAAERLVELSAIVERLVRVIDPEYIPVWMRKPNPALGDRKPLDVIREGGYLEVSRVVAALESPTAS
jgi:uncharacterized protein (DUF2384 family)